MSVKEFTFEDLRNILVNRVGLPDDAVRDDLNLSFGTWGSTAGIRRDPASDPAGVRSRSPTRTHRASRRSAKQSTIRTAGFAKRRDSDGENGHLGGGGSAARRGVGADERPRELDEPLTEYASVDILEREGDTAKFRLTMHPDPEYDGKV